MKIIAGLGKTGLSCARYLTAQKTDFIVMDSRENPPEKATFQQLFPEIPLILGKFDEILVKKADEIILSPGLSPALFPREKIVSDIELFAREAAAPMIGISGTNAKGTVTLWVTEMIKAAGLKVAAGGNLSPPALDLLIQPLPDFYVLELSSFQLETTQYLPLKAASILNLSPDHLDRHGTLSHYHQIKQLIYKNTETAIFNREDTYTLPVYETSRQISFGGNVPASGEFGVRENYLAYGQEKWLPIEALKVKGRHNTVNALAACALGQAIGLSKDSMIEALQTFSGLSHRCEWIGNVNDIDWYNDSKGTNIGATLAALRGLGDHLDGKIILIAGGVGKGADFSLLREAVQRYVKSMILIGQDAPLIANALSDYTEINVVKTLKDAVLMANKLAAKKDIVLLSPACASLDMFRDFEDRGEQFKALVREYILT